jgi:hypothetical protein
MVPQRDSLLPLHRLAKHYHPRLGPVLPRHSGRRPQGPWARQVHPPTQPATHPRTHAQIQAQQTLPRTCARPRADADGGPLCVCVCVQVYEHLGRPIKPGSEFDLFLARTQAKQEAHRKTKTDESHLTQAEIRTEFPDLFKEIMAIPGMHSVHAGLTPASARPSPMPSPAPESPARGW